MMNKIGTFKLEASFNITDRGIIAVCQFIHGTVRLNSFVTVSFKEQFFLCRIIGIESGKLGTDNILRWGLLLSFNDKAVQQQIAVERLSEQIIEIMQEESC